MIGLSSIRERKLIQWVAAYVAVAWAILQGVDMLAGTWGWPPIVARLAFVVLVTGFGFAVVLAFFHGERGRQRVSGMEVALLFVVALAGVTGGSAVWSARTEASDPAFPAAPGPLPVTTLAVLPFQDQSPNGGTGYLGDGIAETLISSLARIDALTVVARTSAFAFRDSGDVRAIGRRLGAGSIVEGTVTQVGARVRITASLIDTDNGANVWADRFDKETDEADLFDLQDDVARQIVEALRVHLTDGGRIVRGGTRSPDAQRAYYLGVHHWTNRTTEDMQKATELFREAIAADSAYAEAWGGLALAYTLSTPQEYSIPGITREAALDSAEATARHALELDSELPSAYTALGDASTQRGHLDQGERWFREAIRVSPGYATAHHWLADLLMIKVDGEGALAEIDLAESLDPVAPAILVERAEALMMLGRNEEVVAQMDKALDLLPESELVRTFATLFFTRMGKWDRVAEQVRRLGESAGAAEEGTDLADALGDPERRPAMLRELARLGVERAATGAPAGRWGVSSGEGSVAGQLMRRPEMRFLVTLELQGMDAALDLLASEAKGPRAMELYPPALPALIGPDHVHSEHAQEVLRLVSRRQ